MLTFVWFSFHISPLLLVPDECPHPVDLKLVELVSPELRLGLGILEQNVTVTTPVMRGTDRTDMCIESVVWVKWVK